MSFWRHIFSWQGRAKRREVLFVFLLTLPLALQLDGLPLAFRIALSTVFWAVSTCALMALQARRLHDLGLSAWWMLTLAVPWALLFSTIPLLPDHWLMVAHGPLGARWTAQGPFMSAAVVCVLALTAMYWAVLALWPGQRRDNRFGATWHDAPRHDRTASAPSSQAS